MTASRQDSACGIQASREWYDYANDQILMLKEYNSAVFPDLDPAVRYEK